MADLDQSTAELSAMADLVTPMAIRVAATLRIADHLTEGPRIATELAAEVSADPDALERLLRHLVAVGVFSRDDSGRYALSAKGEVLRDDHPAGIRAGLDIESAIGRAEFSLVHLLHSIRTGEAAFPLQFGGSFWDDLSADPERTASYDAQMGSDVAAWAREILPAYDWGSLGHVVDVGGGNGTLLAAILLEYPVLRGTVVDQVGTAESARKTLAAAGVEDRSDVVVGSFFDPLPKGAGGYVLSAILHNWNDDASTSILLRCAEAAGIDGAVFIVEKVGADAESPNTAMDLRMLAFCGGRERGVGELTALASECKLKVATVYPAGSLAIVELRAR